TIASTGASTQENLDVEIAMFTVLPDVVLFGIGMVRPQSVGEMQLSSRDPAAAPRIRLNYFAERGDLDGMVCGVRVVRKLIATEALALFVGAELFPGAVMSDDDALAAAIRATPTSYAHATGTCRMGNSAESSVVDQTGRVHGMANLRVIDASIMPALPSVPTN